MQNSLIKKTDIIKNKISLENLMCLFIIICPILDVISYLYRNFFDASFSPSTIIRPIIPCIVFVVLFFKEKNKAKKIGVSALYAIYSIIHLILFQKLNNGSSYGTLTNEIQYIINYSFMIINLYIFYRVIKDMHKFEKSVLISFTIYIVILFFSIITNTSSSTYIEGIGYKGYFESGNSLCTVLLLSLCIILTNLDLKDWKKVILIILTGIYLSLFSGMRTGLFGFIIIIAIFIFGKIFINLRDNIKISKRRIILITAGIILAVILLITFGSKTLERRKQLEQSEQENIDSETNEARYVTGDILEIYKQIKNGTLEEGYMTEAEKAAIVDLCEFAEEIKLSNVNLRIQQFLYNIFLVKEQSSLELILFGNGYKNQTGELVMEMEQPAILVNFGIIGFILYSVPFIAILILGIYKLVKTRKSVRIDLIMCVTGSGLAIALSTLSGYVFFNFSSMTIAIILSVLILKKTQSMEVEFNIR